MEEASKDPETWKLIEKLLPKLYSEFKDIFSKTKANTLPPYYIYNYKIILKEPLPSLYLPLYRQLVKELKAIKEYLVKNL